MVESVERRYEAATSSKRLTALSQFQYKALLKAFSFPEVRTGGAPYAGT